MILRKIYKRNIKNKTPTQCISTLSTKKISSSMTRKASVNQFMIENNSETLQVLDVTYGLPLIVEWKFNYVC